MTLQPASRNGEQLEPAEWDGYIQSSAEGHLLQSYGWGEVKHRHGWQVQRFLVREGEAIGAAQVLWRKTPIAAMGYVARGPVIVPHANEDASKKLFAAIHAEAQARNAMFLKVEPNSLDPSVLLLEGFRPSAHTVQPRVTQLLDLTRDLDDLMADQHEKTRYNIKLAARKGVRVYKGSLDDVEVFHSLLMETGTRNGFGNRPTAYYVDVLNHLGGNAEILLAEHEGDILASMLLAKFNGEAIYLYGGSTSHKRNLMPTYLLQWEAIKRARDEGMKRYDFWAVPAELAPAAAGPGEDSSAASLPPATENEGGLWGVYRFKRGFGGSLQAYAGAYDYVYDRRRYWLWTRMLPHALKLLRRRAAAEVS